MVPWKGERSSPRYLVLPGLASFVSQSLIKDRYRFYNDSLIRLEGGGVVAEAMCCVRSVFHPRPPSRRKAEGLPKRFLQEGPQASFPTGLVREESGIFSWALSRCEAMAGEEESGVGDVWSTDDTRQDTPLQAFPEADSPDPGG